MYKQEKKLILSTCLEIRKYNLVSLSGGNVSMRVGNGRYLVTPSGMLYEDMKFNDIVVIDDECRVIEGTRKPSSDAAALVYIYQKMSGINVIIHTHQPYATAAGFITNILPEFLVTLIDANKNEVHVAPFTPSSDIGMGILAVEYAGDSLAVILKHHGVLAFGSNIKEALYSAVYLEEAAKTYILARSAGADIPALDPILISKEKFGWLNYGQ